MKRRSTRMVISLFAVLGAHLLYRLAVCPWLVPTLADRPPTTQQKDTTETAPGLNPLAEQLQALFAPGSWELQDPEVLQSDELTLLMRAYKQLADGQLEIRPVTLIYYPQGRRFYRPGVSAPPVVMQAEGGAVLQFDASLDLQRGRMGRPVRGQLVGQVRIYRPAGNNGEPRLDLVTGNVQIDKQKIWTPQPVEFQYGETYGRGRDLIVMLDEASRDKQRPWSSLQSIELVHLDQLRLAGPWLKGLDGPNADPQLPSPPVDVACAGSLRVDNRLQVMTIEDQVQAVRQWSNGLVDRIVCSRLDVHYQMQQTADRKRPQLSPSRMEMTGLPLTIDIPTRQWSVTGDRLEYDVQRSEVRVESATAAVLKTAEHYLRSPRVSYRSQEPAAVTGSKTQRLGTLYAEGPGSYQGTAGTESMQATWQGVLKFEPIDGLHRLFVDRGLQLGLGQSGSLSATELELWVEDLGDQPAPTSQPAATQPVVAQPVAASRGASPLGSATGRLQPRRIAARGSVAFQFQQLSGATQQLSAEFVTARPESAVAPDATPANGATNPTTPAGTGPQRPKTRPQMTNQMKLNGQQMQLVLEQGGGLRQADIKGDVVISADGVTTANGQPPRSLSLSGQTLHIETTPQGYAVGQLDGAPAKLESQQMQLLSTSIQVNQETNQIWIPGHGEMTMPMAMASSLTAAGGAGAATSNTAANNSAAAAANGAAAGAGGLAVVRWKEGLKFNGSVIQLLSDVWVQTENQRIHMDRMEIQLAQGVSLLRPSSNTTVEPRWVRGLGNVYGDSRTVGRDGRFGWERFAVGDFEYDQQTGAVRASGPGWIVSVRPGQSQSLPGAPAPPPSATNDSNSLRYLRVDFQKELVGNLQQRTAEFRGDVRGIVGPVVRWEDTIVADSPAQLPPGGAMMRCDALSLSQLPGGPTMPGQPAILWGIVATGNSAVATPSLTALGERISYDQQKDLLVMEGSGRRPATLFQRKPDQSQESRLTADRIKVWPNSGRFELDGAQLNLSGLPEVAPNR
ncbi:MAG: hypothetical protein U0795_17000 [Pirellulales bacterium]